MRVIVEKPDLDTCLTGIILGVSGEDEIVISGSEAQPHDIENPYVLCIEAGGSGLVHLNNFDHHDPSKYYPPACRQAYEYRGLHDIKIERLVDYVCMVDDRIQDLPEIEFPSLSNIFSGMLLVEKDKRLQFIKGMEILGKVLKEDIDPFATIPATTEWQAYIAAKEENKRKVDEVLQKAEYFSSKSGMKVGFVQSDFIGGIGALYAQGCDVVILFNPAFGEPAVAKYTIAGNNKKVSHLLEHFDKIEKGWGGRETIIGSPRGGASLSVKQVLEIVLESL